MKKLKNYLIHLLGGFTEAEMVAAHVSGLNYAAYRVTLKLLNHAHTINGCTADEWCKDMYDIIQRLNNKYKADIEDDSQD